MKQLCSYQQMYTGGNSIFSFYLTMANRKYEVRYNSTLWSQFCVSVNECLPTNGWFFNLVHCFAVEIKTTRCSLSLFNLSSTKIKENNIRKL